MGSARRLDRERRTVRAMLELYCRHHHGASSGLCRDCADLEGYARRRLERCPYGPAKPTCVNCPVHCYRAAERERMREVMRFAGPRMIWRHPVLALLHLLDGRREPPPPPGSGAWALEAFTPTASLNRKSRNRSDRVTISCLRGADRGLARRPPLPPMVSLQSEPGSRRGHCP